MAIRTLLADPHRDLMRPDVVVVPSAETSRVTLDGPRRSVIGRFAPKSDVSGTIDLSKVRARISPVAPHIVMASDVQD